MATVLKPAEFWDREVTAAVMPAAHGWMAHAEVRHYINRCVGGANGSWPLDWFQRVYPDRRFERALSIGCGTGALERDLVRRGIVMEIEAFDASPVSIAIARNVAAAEGMTIRYSVADFNAVELRPNTYQLICFHQSLHHVQELERLLGQIRTALRPDGLLYLDEFLGPSRTYWSEYTVRWYRALYRLLDRDIRLFDDLALPIQEEDPSEAIRSAEIYSRLVVGFSIEHFRGYGGNLLAVLFPNLAIDRLSDEDVRTLIAAEEALIANGAPHFYAVIVARPKSGVQAGVAGARYHIERRFPVATGRLRSVIRRLRGRRQSDW